MGMDDFHFKFKISDDNSSSGIQSADLEKLEAAASQLKEEIYKIKRRLGMLDYHYPDFNGDGIADSTDAALLTEFLTELGGGSYSEYPTLEEKWEAFAAEKGLQNSSFVPDVNGDGVLDVSDSSVIISYAAEAGAGGYSDDEAGFMDYMRNVHDSIFDTSISCIRVMTKSKYDKLSVKKEDVLYLVKSENSFWIYLGSLPLRLFGTITLPIGQEVSQHRFAKTVAGTMEWAEEE